MASNDVSDIDPIASGDPNLLAMEVLTLRDLLRGAEAQIGELTTKLARLEEQRRLSEAQWIHRMEHTDRQLDAAIERVSAIEASTSWKIGQLVLKPVGLWRKSNET